MVPFSLGLPMALDLTPPRHRIMTLPEFCRIPDNPRQRNTAMHLKKAQRYLSTPSPAQAVVHVAVLPDRRMVKLDGHTRALLWEQNPEQAPDCVTAILYDVNDENDAVELYTHFDNSLAAETTRDQWTGAFREIGFHPANVRLQQGEGGYPLRMAHGGYLGLSGFSKESPYIIAPQWKNELLLADRIPEMRRKLIHVGIWAAMFATFKRDGERALPFWITYFNEAGESQGNSLDAIKFLHERRLEMGKTKASEELQFAATALGCYRRWKRGTRLLRKNGQGKPQYPDPISIANFLAPVRDKSAT
jgi:hypothetical protein